MKPTFNFSAEAAPEAITSAPANAIAVSLKNFFTVKILYLVF
jgi:hypothetical protein